MKKTIGIIIFVIIGVGLTTAGLVWLGRTIVFVNSANRTTGTVVEIQIVKSRRSGATYRPVFTYADASGMVHTNPSASSSSGPGIEFHVGDKVDVLYTGAGATRAEIDSFGTIWLGPVAISGFGLLWVCGLFLNARKTKSVSDVNTA